jgi:hypothetical protein
MVHGKSIKRMSVLVERDEVIVGMMREFCAADGPANGLEGKI